MMNNFNFELETIWKLCEFWNGQSKVGNKVLYQRCQGSKKQYLWILDLLPFVVYLTRENGEKGRSTYVGEDQLCKK